MVYFSIYYNNKVIFNSDYSYADVDQLAVLEDQDEIEDISTLNSDYFYKLTLYDGTDVAVDMFCYDFYNYGYYVIAAAIFLGIVLFESVCIINLLFEGQGNAEEQPEYQVMIKRKGSHCTSFIITSFFGNLYRKTSGGWGLVPNYLNIMFLRHG